MNEFKTEKQLAEVHQTLINLDSLLVSIPFKGASRDLQKLTDAICYFLLCPNAEVSKMGLAHFIIENELYWLLLET
jgi:hypothetical protein